MKVVRRPTLLKDITGKKFGKLLVLTRVADRMAGKTNHRETWYRVVCDCGQEKEMRGYMLRGDRVHSCGCVKGNLRHGFCGTHAYELWCSAKSRAKAEKLPFDIFPADIVIPETCPLLKIPIFRGKGWHTPNSPSVDKLIPALGYTKRNILVISYRANVIKQNASLEELKTLTSNLEEIFHAR